MQKKTITRIIACLLALLLVAGVIVMAVSSANTLAAPTQSEIDDLKKKESELAGQKTDIQEKIASLEYEQAQMIEKKEMLDEQMRVIQEEIVNITDLINIYTRLVAEKEVELVEAQRAEDAQWELYKTRMRAMEENGLISYIAVLFSANSFPELLSKIDSMGEVMKSDEQLYSELEAARIATQEAKDELKAVKAEMEATREQLRAKEAELDAAIAEASELITNIENSIEESEEMYAALEAARVEIASTIEQKTKELEEHLAELRAAGDASAGWVSGSGTFVWPAPASRTLTSYYGPRTHPITGVYKNHSGIDIGASFGTNILAADGGMVITSTYNSAYGNYVMIDHGNGLKTLYAHMSQRLVSYGESVSQGEVIGLVGSTGMSTGPHLHFEVYVNGSLTNPLNYL